MTKEIEALETLDEYSDDEYSAYLEYVALRDQCMVEPDTLYINKNHEFLSEWNYFANTDGLEVKVIEENHWRKNREKPREKVADKLGCRPEGPE